MSFQVSCRLHQVFLQDLSVFSAVILPSTFTSLPGPTAMKYPHNIILPPLHTGDGMFIVMHQSDGQKTQSQSHQTREASIIITGHQSLLLPSGKPANMSWEFHSKSGFLYATLS